MNHADLQSSDDVGVDKREVDENIAYVVKQDEDSYADQMASMDSQKNNPAIDNEESFLVKNEDGEQEMDKNQKKELEQDDQVINDGDGEQDDLAYIDEKNREIQLLDQGQEYAINDNQEFNEEQVDDAHDSDEEFRRIEARISAQVLEEKQNLQK